MVSPLFFLLSFLLIGSVQSDLSSVISSLNTNYTFSDYLNVDYTSVWWRNHSSLIDFAVLGRVNDGWVSVGFGVDAVLEGMVNVMAGSTQGVFRVVDGKFRAVSVSAVSVLDVEIVVGDAANFTLLMFSWDTSVGNEYFNLTLGEVGINMIFSLDDSLDIVVENSAVRVVDLATGGNANAFQGCNAFTNCRSPNGQCTDQFMCSCNEGWKGPRCTTPIPPPPPPPPTPNPPTNYKYSLEMQGMEGVTLRWNNTGDSVLISVEAKNHDGYVAFGINNFTGMIGADAVIGWIDKEGKGQIEAYNLTSKMKSPTPIPDIYHITDPKVYYYNGSTTITFERKKITGQHNIYNNNTIVLASIGKTPDPDILKHINRVSCCPSVDFFTGTSLETFNFKLLHGVLMVSAWGFLLPLGVLCARYLKGFGRLWFTTHRIIQPTGFIISLVAVVIIFYATDRTKSPHFQIGHPLGGLIIMILGVLQIVFAVIRPHPPKSEKKEKKSGVRVCWEYKHLWMGRILLLSSWVVILFGMCKYTGYDLDLPKCIAAPEYTPFFIAYLSWIVILVIIIIVLEWSKFSKRGQYQTINNKDGAI